jgi:hypothetical protein
VRQGRTTFQTEGTAWSWRLVRLEENRRLTLRLSGLLAMRVFTLELSYGGSKQSGMWTKVPWGDGKEAIAMIQAQMELLITSTEALGSWSRDRRRGTLGVKQTGPMMVWRKRHLAGFPGVWPMGLDEWWSYSR